MQQRKYAGLHGTSPLVAEWVERALELALELEGALRHETGPCGGDASFRLRLARAHALGAVDALTDLVIRTSRPEGVGATTSGTFRIDEAPASCERDPLLEKHAS
jgi:hypothetical protein